MLTWTEDTDDHDNTTHEATSHYHDEGVPFTYRIEPFLVENRVVWSLDKTDAELMPTRERTCFLDTVDEAKAACEAAEVE